MDKFSLFLLSAGEDIDELCPSMYSFHSDPNEKNVLLKHFRDNGIETTVDRQAKKQRIRDWIQNSVIEEVDEEVFIYFYQLFYNFNVLQLFLTIDIYRKKTLILSKTVMKNWNTGQETIQLMKVIE